MEKHIRPPRGKSCLLLGLFMLLVSCSQDDRIATVTCDGATGSPIPVPTDLSSNGQRASSIGYLNSWELSLGSIVRIAPGSTQSGAITEWRTLAPSKHNPPLSSTALRYSTIGIGAGFQVHLDEDIRAVGRRAGLDLDTEILQHTIFYLYDPTIRSLPDIENSVNEDPSIVDGIRMAAGAYFAVVSRTIDGSNLGLFNTYEEIPVNTLEIGNSYVHVSYSCRTVERLGRQARRAEGVLPLIIYLTPIRYDELTSRVMPGPREMDVFQHE